jgi:hypothetical protein
VQACVANDDVGIHFSPNGRVFYFHFTTLVGKWRV